MKLDEISNKVQDLDTNLNNTVVEILKDTIEDCTKHNNKLFALAITELVVILITIIVALALVYKQNLKYQEFLSQYDFETTVFQDTDDNSTINSGIRVER